MNSHAVLRIRLVFRQMLLSVIVIGLLSPMASAQQPAEETVKSFTLADGFEATLFAAEPMISNPITIDVDTQGRVWVTEGVYYRRARKIPPIDKIKVLEDTDGDGRADKMTVFTSDLNAAMGVCVAGDKVYVPESPNIYVYEDKDGDLKADGPRKLFLTGFGGENHDHGVHSLVFGPDHKLYMTQGDTGFDVTGLDGKHIKFQWGAMIRCEQDGTKLEDFAVNFRNPFELAVDSFGNVWCSDNDNDGLKSTRICWILEGGNYGWFGRPENIRNPDGSFDPIHHWRADKPGFVPYAMITGFGSPCGMTFYEGTAFGPQYDGKIFHCDAGPREVRSYSPQKKSGIGYGVAAENIITSPDGYFRPDDVCVAPDGALFVSDWYDGGVGGHAYNDPDRGRIYRIAPKGKTLTRREKPGPYDNDDDAIIALASPNHATTFLARQRLLASGETAIPKLAALVQGNDRRLMARALWLLDRIGGTGRDYVLKELSSKDPAFRALAVRILRRHGTAYEKQILDMAGDQAPEVIREVLLAIPSLKSSNATETLISLFDRYQGQDRYLLEALHIAAKGREREIFQRVANGADVKFDPRLVNLVRILRPDDAQQFLAAKLSESDIGPEARAALLSALGAVSTPDAGRSVAAVLMSKAATTEIKRQALISLAQKLAGPWSTIKDSTEVTEGLRAALADPKLENDALDVIAAAGLESFLDDIIERLRSDDKPRKLKAIDVAARLMLDEAGTELARELKSPDREVQQAALRTMVALQICVPLAKSLTDPAAPADLKPQTVDLLMRSASGAIALLPLVESKTLAPQLTRRVLDAAVEHPDVNVRLLYEKFIPEAERPKTLGQSFTPEQILKLDGDAERGRSVFLRSGAASCSKCHRVRDQGADIGPELSLIGRKYERRALLETIMNPSAGIAPEYVPHLIETSRGKVFAGFIQARTDDAVVLKTVDGNRLQIKQEDIENDIEQKTSLMPELVLKNVTAQDAADLLAYLMSLREAEVYAKQFRAVGPFANDSPADRTKVYAPEKTPGAIDPKAKFTGLSGKSVGWQVAKTRSYDGSPPAIDLTRLTSRAKTRHENVIYYFAVVLISSAAQPAHLNIGSNDGIQVWLNGEKVHEFAKPRGLKAGDDKVAVQLKNGKNLILLKLDQGGGTAGLILSAEARGNVSFSLP